MGKNTVQADSAGIANATVAQNKKKLTKRELLELADYLYSRYEASKKPLNKRSWQPIIEENEE